MERTMQSRIDALVAEIARTIDSRMLADDSNFADLWRPYRSHVLLTHLVRRDVARTEKWSGTVRWLPSRNLEINFGVKGHVIPDEVERTERPLGMNTLVDEFSEYLTANTEFVDEATSYYLRRFAMYQKGLFEYRGKKDGRCQFRRTERRSK
jgi:hypothetical protein